MDNPRIKSDRYAMIPNDGHAIAAIVALPEGGKYRLYVAWEWGKVAEEKLYRFCKARELTRTIGEESILECADYGFQMDEKEAKKVFRSIF